MACRRLLVWGGTGDARLGAMIAALAPGEVVRDRRGLDLARDLAALEAARQGGVDAVLIFADDAGDRAADLVLHARGLGLDVHVVPRGGRPRGWFSLLSGLLFE